MHLIFSFDRPLQCEGLLYSLFRYGKLISPVKILVKASSERIRKSYEAVFRAYPVEPLWESVFKLNVLQLLKLESWVSFFVDDAVGVFPWEEERIHSLLRKRSDILSVSLRFGRNTHYSYCWDKEQGLPRFKKEDEFLTYRWKNAAVDWSWPIELSSSVYRQEDVYRTLAVGEYNGPNQMEYVLAKSLPEFWEKRPLNACYELTRLFCIPINKVQKVHPKNRVALTGFTPDELQSRFEEGYRLDVESLNGFIPNSALMEVCFSLVRRDYLKGEQYAGNGLES